MGVVGMLIGCGICSNGELGTEASERILAESSSTSDTEPGLPFFFLLVKALVNELRNWKRHINPAVYSHTMYCTTSTKVCLYLSIIFARFPLFKNQILFSNLIKMPSLISLENHSKICVIGHTIGLHVCALVFVRYILSSSTILFNFCENI